MQEQLPDFGLRFGTEAEPPSAGVDAVRTLFPLRVGDAHWGKQARGEQLHHRFAGSALHNRRQQVGAHRIVLIFGARRIVHRFVEHLPHPVGGVGAHRPIGSDARFHREQIVDGDIRQIFRDVFRQFVGEKGN